MTIAPPNRGWIVSPVFDLLFFANLGWLLLLVPGVARADTPIDFWQIYFLTLPHRWLTLVLVVADRDRREGQTRKLQVVALLAAVVVVAAYLGGKGAFLCIAMIDFVWNAWHFGSQHAGVLRIYTKKVGGGSAWLERHGVRFFVVYGALRAAEWTSGEIKADSQFAQRLQAADLAVLIIPILLLVTNLAGATRDRIGKLAYLGSVCLLYTGLILSIREEHVGLTLAFSVAGVLFHAVEYLAIVTHYAWRRKTVGSEGAFRAMAGYWLVFLGGYIVILGTMGAFFAREAAYATAWQGLNLWASTVHYAYDGMIWKLRRPETAAALGIAPKT